MNMRERFHPHIEKLAKAVDRVNWNDRMIYGAYLAQTYYYVRHSTRLIALGASRFSMDHNQAHERFLKHLREEANHEVLALRDLAAMDLKIDQFAELPALRAFYQVQYHNIEHISPFSFMGYILALEGLAVERGNSLHETVVKTHGPKAGMFLKVHAAEDVDHLEKAYALVSELPEAELDGVERSLETSCYLFAGMLETLPQAVLSTGLNLKKSSKEAEHRRRNVA